MHYNVLTYYYFTKKMVYDSSVTTKLVSLTVHYAFGLIFPIIRYLRRQIICVIIFENRWFERDGNFFLDNDLGDSLINPFKIISDSMFKNGFKPLIFFFRSDRISYCSML